MGASFSRMTELINDTDEELEIRECVDGDSNGEYAVPILLRGGEQKKIRATKFTDRRIGSTRSRVIKIMRNGVFHEEIFLPDDFRSNKQLIFSIENERLVVDKVKAEGLSEEFHRLKVLASFRRPNLREIRMAGHHPVPMTLDISHGSFYVVFKGRKPGIYHTWEDCEEQINGFSAFLVKEYDTFEEANIQLNRYMMTQHSINLVQRNVSELPVTEAVRNAWEMFLFGMIFGILVIIIFGKYMGN